MSSGMMLAIRRNRHNLKQLVKEPVLFTGVLLVLSMLIVFIIYPLITTVRLSLFPEGKLSLDVYKYIFSHRRFSKAIFNSTLLGLIVATISTLIGFIFAFALTRTRIPGHRIFKNLVLLPIISPPFMFALSVILLFGRNGLITAGLLGLDRYNIYGLKGLVIVQSIGLFPLAYLTLSGILQAIDPDLETCAMNLGAKRLKTFFTITLPLALPGIFAAWLLVFVGSLTDFGNPIVIGGEFDVLSVQAYMEFTGMANLPRGAGLAIILLIPTVAIFLLQKQILRKKSYTTITGKSGRRVSVKISPLANRVLFSICLIICLFVLMFYFTIIAGSFIKIWGINWGFTFEHFTYSFDVGLKTLKNTLILAIISTPITALLGMIIAYFVVRKAFPGKHVMEIVTMMSYAIPGTAVGIGYILAFNKPPFLLSGTAFILIACYVFRNVPIGVESGIAALKQISSDIEESSTNLGADSSYTFRRITLPLITPSFFAGATFCFVRCMTAISAIIFLVSARWNHLTVLVLAQTEIMRLGVASALSFVLIVIIMVFIVIIRKATGLVQAVNDISFTISSGEFVTLLGPSGCGKTTTLRLVAGFEALDSGEIFLGNKKINDLPAYTRNMPMVFQSYALFPHLSIFENIAYGLKA